MQSNKKKNSHQSLLIKKLIIYSKCRYCNEILEKKGNKDVCKNKECALKKKDACNKILDCGRNFNN